MSGSSSWYTVVTGDDLEQGDILLNIPIVEISADFEWSQVMDGDYSNINTSIKSADAIIITQTCDLRWDSKIEQVALCLVTEMRDHPGFGGSDPSNADISRQNNLRQGRYIQLHLLNECAIPGFGLDFLVVQFNSLYTLPIELVRQLALKQGQRLRLMSPYKEHLSQAFARVFMRVGLPSDIPEFTKRPKA